MEREKTGKGTSHRVLDGASKIREAFDVALSAELQQLCGAVDDLIEVALAASEKVKGFEEERRLQELSAQYLIRKAINDIYGGVELMRLGYMELTLAAMRIGLEGFALATLVCDDKNIWNQYLKDEFSTQKAVDKMLRAHKGQIPSEIRDALCEGHRQLHKYAHPSVAAIRSQLPVSVTPGQFPIGGHFEDEKIERYRSVLKDLVTLAKNMEGFIRVRYTLGGAELVGAGK